MNKYTENSGYWISPKLEKDYYEFIKVINNRENCLYSMICKYRKEYQEVVELIYDDLWGKCNVRKYEAIRKRKDYLLLSKNIITNELKICSDVAIERTKYEGDRYGFDYIPWSYIEEVNNNGMMSESGYDRLKKIYNPYEPLFGYLTKTKKRDKYHVIIKKVWGKDSGHRWKTTYIPVQIVFKNKNKITCFKKIEDHINIYTKVEKEYIVVNSERMKRRLNICVSICLKIYDEEFVNDMKVLLFEYVVGYREITYRNKT